MLFGDVITEIAEETYEDPGDPESKDFPPVGNGNYIVTMRLKKDLPNYLSYLWQKDLLGIQGKQETMQLVLWLPSEETLSLREYGNG